MIRPVLLLSFAILALAPEAVRAQEGVGEVLLSRLGCTSCHRGDARALERLAPMPAPRLHEVGRRLSPSALRDRVRGHGVMPDLLHGRSAPEAGELTRALVSFLVATTGPFSGEGVGVDATTIERGKRLVDTIGCRACHGGELETRGLASATSLQTLAAFLRHPLAVRPSARMPGMRLSADEAFAIATYLLRDQASGDIGYAPGLWAEAFHLSKPGANPDLSSLEPAWRGIAETPTIAEAPRHDDVGLRFTGFVDVPATGEWTFFTTSDDGSRLYIGDELVVNNDGHHAMAERSGRIQLEAGRHRITVTFFQASGGLGLEVSWAGPGVDKQLVPPGAYGRKAALFSLPPADLQPRASDVERGRRAFSELGCAACHELPETRWAGGAPALGELAGKRGGCLSSTASAGLPRYELDESERSALLVALADAPALNEPLLATDAIRHAMLRLDCYACHARNGAGGPQGAARELFESTSDLGDEGRIPPDLSGVGAKLTAAGLREMLTGQVSLRSHMLTRMPEFGEGHVTSLAELLVQADAREPTYEPPDFRPEDLALGRKLVGTDGVACITCHDFGGNAAIGTPGIDLLTASTRLRHDWFHRLLWRPYEVHPDTRMPSFWTESTRHYPELPGGGDPHYQIDAIWTYLALGASAPPPKGIAPSEGEYELVPIERPILFGTFMDGLSARTICVGFPERVHVAFDAHNVRLAKAWRGRFMNALGTWQGRAGQLSKPAGDDVIDMPPGAAFAVLASRDAPWPTDDWALHGRTLDAQGRPTFHYRLGDLVVKESPVPVLSAAGASLLRRFEVIAPKEISLQNLYLRAAVGDRIEQDEDLTFRVISGARVLRIRTGAQASSRAHAGGTELLVPVTNKHFEVRMSW